MRSAFRQPRSPPPRSPALERSVELAESWTHAASAPPGSAIALRQRRSRRGTAFLRMKVERHRELHDHPAGDRLGDQSGPPAAQWPSRHTRATSAATTGQTPWSAPAGRGESRTSCCVTRLPSRAVSLGKARRCVTESPFPSGHHGGVARLPEPTRPASIRGRPLFSQLARRAGEGQLSD